MSINSNDNLQALLDAGKALGAEQIIAPNTAPAILRPEGYTVEYLNHAEPAPLPDFITGSAQLDDAESFIEYVKAFKRHNTRLTAKINRNAGPQGGATIVAKIDYHEGGADGQAMRNAHVAVYPLPLSVEMAAWLGISGQPQSQGKLARFLDDHLRDIREPEAAAVLELSEGLEASKGGTFQSRIDRSRGGVKLYWEEEVEAKTSANNLAIPRRLMLRIPVYEGGKLADIDARLDIDVQQGKAVIVIQLVELHVVMRKALDEVRADITAGTGLPILTGALG